MVFAAVGAAGYSHYRSVKRERAAALLELGFAESDLAKAQALAEELAAAEFKTFTAGRQFDAAGEVSFYEAHRLDPNQWSGTKVVLMSTQAALDRNRLVDRRGGVTYKLRVLDKGREPVTMTNRNAYREWTTTEYFTHYRVVTAADLAAAKQTLLQLSARHQRAVLAVAEARFIWQSWTDAAIAPVSSEARAAADEGASSATPIVFEIEVCGESQEATAWPSSSVDDGPFTIEPGNRVGPVANGKPASPADLAQLGYVVQLDDGGLYWWRRIGDGGIEATARDALSGCHGGSADGRVETYLQGISVTIMDERFRTPNGHGVGTSFARARRAMCPGGCELEDEVMGWDAAFSTADGITMSRAEDDLIREVQATLKN